MNGKTTIISQSEEKQLEQQTNQKKTFTQDIFNINYVNTSKIYYQPTSHSSDVKVNNYLCYQEGQNLYKVTEIIYEDKLIRIEDKFDVNIDPEKLKSIPLIVSVKKEKPCPKNIEKIRIFSKDARKNGKIQKKDKKNIVKNIVKIFLSWLQKKQVQNSNVIWETALNQLRQMLENENFNNRLIKNLVSNDNTNKAFLAFLTDDAEDEIKYSRIQDKQSHYEAIELYISLLSESKNKIKFNSQDFSQSMNDEAFSENDVNQMSIPEGSRHSKSENNMSLNIEKASSKDRNSSSGQNTNSSHRSNSNKINSSTAQQQLKSSHISQYIKQEQQSRNGKINQYAH